MGGIYRRGTRLWAWYFDAASKRIFEPTSASVGEEARAAGGSKSSNDASKPKSNRRSAVELTVRAYGERWLKGRPTLAFPRQQTKQRACRRSTRSPTISTMVTSASAGPLTGESSSGTR
jgi:hypothetical protein